MVCEAGNLSSQCSVMNTVCYSCVRTHNTPSVKIKYKYMLHKIGKYNHNDWTGVVVLFDCKDKPVNGKPGGVLGGLVFVFSSVFVFLQPVCLISNSMTMIRKH